MKFVILFVLCASILSVTCMCPSCQQRYMRQKNPFFNDPNTSNTDMKAYFVKYVHSMNRISTDVLRTKTPNQLVAMAIDELYKLLSKQPQEAQLIRQHLQYFLDYRNGPVPQAPFIDFNKDLSKLSEPELRVYLIGYLHALDEVDERELSYKKTQELVDLILRGLRERHHENKDPAVTDLIMHHYNYFQRLKK